MIDEQAASKARDYLRDLVGAHRSPERRRGLKLNLQLFMEQEVRSSRGIDELARRAYLRLSNLNDEDLVKAPLQALFAVASESLNEPPYPGGGAHRSTDGIDDVNLIGELRIALEAMPPLQACALLAHHRDGMSDEDIAQKLKVTLDELRRLLATGMASLRVLMHRQTPTDTELG